MAEAIFNAKGLPNHEAKSVGLAAVHGSPASTYANELCVKMGKNHHVAKQLNEADILWADMILTMTYTHKQMLRKLYGEQVTVFTLKEFVGDAEFNIADPYGQTRHVYEQTFQEIQKAVDTLITKIQ